MGRRHLGKRRKKRLCSRFCNRKTKTLLAKTMPDKTVASLNKAVIRAFKPLLAVLRNTLALDNGKQFAAHKSLPQDRGQASILL